MTTEELKKRIIGLANEGPRITEGGAYLASILSGIVEQLEGSSDGAPVFEIPYINTTTTEITPDMLDNVAGVTWQEKYYHKFPYIEKIPSTCSSLIYNAIQQFDDYPSLVLSIFFNEFVVSNDGMLVENFDAIALVSGANDNKIYILNISSPIS